MREAYAKPRRGRGARIVVLMGVAGSGKTTVGTMLASALACPFLEGDSLHSAENVDKMSRGVPLTDADRAPWLAAIRARIVESFRRGEDLVVACSALKQAYRRTLAADIPIAWVYLKGPPALLASRLSRRSGHFMKADMLASQLDALEEPADALVVDVSAPPDALVERILSWLTTFGRPDGTTGYATEASRLEQEAGADVRVFPTLAELSRRAAEAAVKTIGEAVRANGGCSVVLSGGTTPRPFYALLAQDFRDRVPWADVQVWWADERYVGADDPRSNYRMARESLLDHVACPAANIHPMPTYFASPDTAAEEYESTLRRYFRGEWPSFDLVILGIGEEGHTASLFPGSAGIGEPSRWVLAVETPAEPSLRLTLTLPALARAASIYVLVTGSNKGGALRHVLTGVPDPACWPASGVRSTRGTLIWWVDRAAAGGAATGALP